MADQQLPTPRGTGSCRTSSARRPTTTASAPEIEEAHEHAHDADEIHKLTEDTETYREVTSDTHAVSE